MCDYFEALHIGMHVHTPNLNTGFNRLLESDVTATHNICMISTNNVWPFFNCESSNVCLRVWETLELNQLKSAPSQLLPVFSGFDRLQTCCH
jgi:hypothetical protein